MATLPHKIIIQSDLVAEAKSCGYAPLFQATKRTTLFGLRYSVCSTPGDWPSEAAWCLAVTKPDDPDIIKPLFNVEFIARPREVLTVHRVIHPSPRFTATVPLRSVYTTAEFIPACSTCENKWDFPLPRQTVTHEGTVETRRMLEPGDYLYFCARSDVNDAEDLNVTPIVRGLFQFFVVT